MINSLMIMIVCTSFLLLLYFSYNFPSKRSLPIDRARHSKKGQPFCMEQYYRLFSSYRYPGKTKDILVTTSERDPFDPEHIIVIYLDQFFVIDVITNGSRLSEEDIYNQLRRVTQFAEESIAGESEMEVQPRVGALTALPRNKWAEVYEQLCQDPENEGNLKTIAKSMFVLCLDKPIQAVEELDETTDINGFLNETNDSNNLNKRDDVSLALQLLHGMGSSFNAANRWYDKTMQNNSQNQMIYQARVSVYLIASYSICMRNSDTNQLFNPKLTCFDRWVIELVKSFSELHTITGEPYLKSLINNSQGIENLPVNHKKEVKRWKLVRFPSVCELAYPRRMKWNLDNNSKSMIDYALNEIDKIADDLDLYILRYKQYGREFPKTVNMSPDSFIQLALQLAHFKLHKYLVPTYESASTRRFALARVDNIRACSMPALEWCKAMTGQTKCSTDEKIRLLRKAMEWQTEIMLETILGHGVDNHLLGLRQIALDHGKELPNIFKDPSYMESNRFRLSTSQVPTTMDAFMCYGAVVPNGYGAAYNPHPDNIVVVISCWRTNPNNNASKFAEMLDSAFTEMRELVLSNPQLAKQPSNEPVEWSIAKSLGADVGLNVTG
uniref:Choline O-acetyltransferase n=1 Tax=Schistosoma haematobium TaxID=6185 RepID=A0A094ZYB3_SCHHA